MLWSVGAKRLLWVCSIGVGLALFLRAFVVESIYIPTPSMEPTIPAGTHLFLDKITCGLRNPARGDVVVFASPAPPREDMVKRVIAVGGDTIELREKKVLLNGKELEESYVKHTRSGERLSGDDLGPLDVPKGSVFVLGDNRDESGDSSVWKDPATGERIYFVPVSSIRGLVRGAYWDAKAADRE